MKIHLFVSTLTSIRSQNNFTYSKIVELSFCVQKFVVIGSVSFNYSEDKFHRILNSVELSLMGRAPDQGYDWTRSRLMKSTLHIMMTSSNGNIFRVTGPSWVEFTDHRWIPLTKTSDAELWFFFNVRLNKRLLAVEYSIVFEARISAVLIHATMSSVDFLKR